MSESFDFSSETEVVTSPLESSETSHEPVVDVQQFNALQQELNSMKQWQQDMVRFIGGQVETQQDPSVELQKMVSDPIAYREALSSQILQQAQQQVSAQILYSEYKDRHPELTQYEDYVGVAVNQVVANAQAKGINLTQRQAIEQGIEKFRSSFPGLSSSAPKVAMRLDVQGAQPPNTTGIAPSAMSDSEWAKYRNSLMSHM